MARRCFSFILFLILFSAIVPSYAQGQGKTAKVVGQIIQNEFPKQPMKSVSVVLEKDGVEKVAVTDAEGKFIFRDLAPGTYSVSVTHVGYKGIKEDLLIDVGSNALFFRMEQNVEQIEAAKVSTEARLMEKRGDTLVVNARVLPKKETDNATELLLQIPGMRVSKKGISYNGEKIARTYVNGTLVYGDITTSAFNSLYATDVEELSVYQELSPVDRHRGLKNGRKETVINVKTRKKIISAADVLVSAAGGADVAESPKARYSGLQTGRFFSEWLQMGETLSIDNIDPGQTAASAMDATLRPALNGDRICGDVAADFQKNWGDRLYGNAFFISTGYESDKNDSESYSARKYNEDSVWESIVQSDTASNQSSSNRIFLNSRLSLNGGKLKSLTIGIFGTVDDSRNSSATRVMQRVDNVSYYGRRSVTDDSRAWNLGVDTRWTDNELGKYRPSIYASLNSSSGQTSSSNIDTLKTTVLRRLLRGESSARNDKVNAGFSNEFTLINSPDVSATLSLGYDFRFDRNVSRRNMLDYWPDPANPVMDRNNTQDYVQDVVGHSMSANFSVFKSRLIVEGGISAAFEQVKNSEHYPEESSMSNNFCSVLPFLNFKYGQDFSCKLSTSSNLPSAEQLRGRIDDSSSYFVIYGNQDLRQSYSTSVRLSWNHTFPAKASSVGMELSSDYEFDPIVEKLTVKDNRIITKPVNGGRCFNAAFGARYGKNYTAKRISTSYSANLRYGSKPSFNADDLFYMNSLRSDLVASFTVRRRYVRMILTPSVSAARSDVSAANAYSSIGTSCNLSGTAYAFKNRLLISGRYRWSGTWFMTGPFGDFSNHFVSVEVGGWAVPKKLYLSLSGHDLLGSSSPIANSFSPNYIDQNWQKTFGPYLMLNARFVFKTKQ